MKLLHYHIFTKKTNATLFTVFVFLVFISIAFSITVLTTDNVGASNEDDISGFAWSDNIGWISFNCTDTSSCSNVNYGVSISDVGVLAGFAWSDNIGWISFNENDLENCPEEPCRALFDSVGFSGWARALSHGGGWDGWVSLSGVDPSYGIIINNENKFEGFAWGAGIVGWLQFNLPLGFDGVEINESQEDPSSIEECQDTADNDEDGRIDANDPGCWTDPTDSSTYNPFDNNESDEPQCADNFDNDADNKIDALDPGCWTNPNFSNTYNPLDDDEFNILQPTLFATPGTIVEGEIVTISWECFNSESSQGVNFSTDSLVSGVTSGSPLEDVIYKVVCSNGGESSVSVTVLHPQIFIEANPSLVQPNNESIISWSSTNVESCIVEGPDGLFGEGFSGSQSTGALINQSVYTLTCETLVDDMQMSVIVNVLPEFGEI